MLKIRISDLDECQNNATNFCEQRCINVPGSYQCICNRGYTLSGDGKTCQGMSGIKKVDHLIE